MSRRLAALVVSALLASACGASPAPAPPPASTPASVPAGPRAVMPSGTVYNLELALTPEAQSEGLMYRENLPEKTGMLFLFAEKSPHHFWMKNTMIPLDIIWLDEAGGVVYVSANTPPCKADPCPTYGPDASVREVLEIAGGMAEKEGVRVGAKLVLQGLAR